MLCPRLHLFLTLHMGGSIRTQTFCLLNHKTYGFDHSQIARLLLLALGITTPDSSIFLYKPSTFSVSLKWLPCNLVDDCLGLVSAVMKLIMFYYNFFFFFLTSALTHKVSTFSGALAMRDPFHILGLCCSSLWGDISDNQSQQDAKCQMLLCQLGSSFEHLSLVLRGEMP